MNLMIKKNYRITVHPTVSSPEPSSSEDEYANTVADIASLEYDSEGTFLTPPEQSEDPLDNMMETSLEDVDNFLSVRGYDSTTAGDAENLSVSPTAATADEMCEPKMIS